MSARSVRVCLWLALVTALPLPIWLLGPGRVPAGHIAELGAAAVAFGAAENFRGVVGLTAAVLLGQAFVYAAILYGVAGLLVRAAGRFGAAALLLAAALLVVAALVPIYRSPYNAHVSRATLVQVYQ